MLTEGEKKNQPPNKTSKHRRKKKKKSHTSLVSTAIDTIRLIKIIIYARLQYNSYFISAAFQNVFLVGLIKFSRISLDI